MQPMLAGDMMLSCTECGSYAVHTIVSMHSVREFGIVGFLITCGEHNHFSDDPMLHTSISLLWKSSCRIEKAILHAR